MQLYKHLFPDLTVIPKGSCKQVIEAVIGVDQVKEHHHTDVYGLIDKDARSDEKLATLAQKGIYALKCHAIESIFYHPFLISQMISERKERDGLNVSLDEVKKAIFDLLRKTPPLHLFSKKAEQQLNDKSDAFAEEVFQRLKDSNAQIEDLIQQFQTKAILEQEIQANFDELLANDDLEGLVSNFNFKETGVFDRVAKSLDFPKVKGYETAVLKFLDREPKLVDEIKERFFDEAFLERMETRQTEAVTEMACAIS